MVREIYVVHRNLDYAERAADSNERKMLAACQLLQSCGSFWKNSVLTLYFDNMNVAPICKKGSSKPRLQKYARYISDLCLDFKIKLCPV